MLSSSIMSIYATLWHLRFPRAVASGADDEWIDVFAQGVPAHIGTPTEGYGYESGDPYESILPPALRIEGDVFEHSLRAVVFVDLRAEKGTTRPGQEYDAPLLVLTGAEYAAITFEALHDRICAALDGDLRPH